jgi:hypothetical protein
MLATTRLEIYNASHGLSLAAIYELLHLLFMPFSYWSNKNYFKSLLVCVITVCKILGYLKAIIHTFLMHLSTHFTYLPPKMGQGVWGAPTGDLWDILT